MDQRTQMIASAPSVDPNKTVMGSVTTLNATQTIKPVQCPVCKTFNPAGMMFCVDCGLIFDRALPADAFGAPAVQLPVLVDAQGREYTLRPGTNVIGREGDVAINHGMASRRHAQITMEGSSLVLEDLGSTNGTQLNGSTVSAGEKKPLASGDALAFGGFEMKLSLPGHAGTTQMLGGNRTAAISAPPQVEAPVAVLAGNGERFALRPGINTFGRKSDNDVTIADPYVSGRHGTIEVADDGFFLTDTGSTNGTVLNDAKLTPNMRTSITSDDVIRLGSLEFRVERTAPDGE